MNLTICKQCYKSTDGKRPDTLFCSAKCRMRYNRIQHKAKVIAELINLCAQIPNDSIQMNGEVTYIKDESILSGKHQFLAVIFLKRYPTLKLEKLMKAKKSKITGVLLAKTLKNWLK